MFKYPLKKYYLSFSIILMLVWSCIGTDIVSDVENLFDPQDPDYVSPSTAIYSGPLDGDILDTNEVTFTFRHSNSLYWPDSSNALTRIPHKILYSFRVDSKNWSTRFSGDDIIQKNLSFWKYDTTTGMHTLTLTNLEDKLYTIEIRSQYPTNYSESNWPMVGFDVNVEDGPELFISPSHAYIDSGNTFFVYARLNDVVDFMGTHIELTYSVEDLKLINYFLEDDSNDFLLQSTGYIISFIESDTLTGNFTMDLGLAGGNVTGVTGSGTLIRFMFSHRGPIQDSTIELNETCTVRDVYNNSVLQRVQSGIVTIW
ncbi:MAG: hypothetical protein IIB95_03220 [Candidatus Marinimicrobia bacterium]|nr:hypothetical protein [Candidatus Neomarinimicrobiota bacterium]